MRESIIENKERTKSYWEQLMLAAAAAAADNGTTIRASNSNRYDLKIFPIDKICLSV